MSGTIENINIWTTIGSNLVTILGGIVGLSVLFYYFGSKKYKALIIKSNKFGVNIDMEDVKNAMFPKKVYDEPITIEYNGEDPIIFLKEQNRIIKIIKENHPIISVFGIAEMFIFFWLGYCSQNPVFIKGFRRLKDNKHYYGNPWARPSLFSLKRGIGVKTFINNIISPYKKCEIDTLNSKEICLFIEISATIDRDKIPSEIKDKQQYSFGLKKINNSFLINEGQVKCFYKKIKEIVFKLDEKLGTEGLIHLFITVPVPFCIKLGQAIHRNGPEYILYDLDNITRDYKKIISTKDFNL